MSTNQQNKEEEVDLGSLFVIIGKGFSNFFNFIWKILLSLFNFFIEILLFFKTNIIKLTIAVLIGAAIGAYFEFEEEKIYGADLMVQPNFKSARQLYNTIGYYNNLIREKDTAALIKTFNISETQALSLRSFEVSPIKSDNDKIELYHEIVKSYDTVATLNYSFKEFKSSFTKFDYKVHKIEVHATSSKVFAFLDEPIISSVVENEFFEKLKKLNLENLYRKDSLLKKDLLQVDTLRQVYMKVMLDEAKRDIKGTSIDLGSQKPSTKELQLFQTNRIINNDLERVTKDLSEKSEVINVVSNFQRIGYPLGGIRRNSIIIYATLGFLFMTSMLLFLKLNRFLDSYKNK